MQAGLVAYLEGQLHGGALEEGRQSYPGYLVVATSAVGLLLSSKAKEGGLLNNALAGLLNSIYVAKTALLILPQAINSSSCLMTSQWHCCYAVLQLQLFGRLAVQAHEHVDYAKQYVFAA
jgi:hypothetical protein